MGGEVYVRDNVAFTDTTQSTDKDTGALLTEGGLGVELNANIGGTLTVP